MLPLKTILHPTDFSNCSEHAFRLACALAHDYGAHLVVLHVVPPPPAVCGDGIIPVPPERNLEALKDKLHQMKAPAPAVQVERMLVEGDPVTEILDMAQDSKCDLIVMGTHGRSAWGRLLMGSVAEGVSRKAHCLVLTVKSPFPPEGEVSKTVDEQKKEARTEAPVFTEV